MPPAQLTASEVAELANVPIRSVHKAIEEKIVERGKARGTGKRITLPIHLVPYAAVIGKLDLKLSKDRKRKLLRAFKDRKASEMTSAPVEIAPAVSVDVAELVGADLGERTDSYVRLRDSCIEENPDILGGTPVIRGTRLSVYALLGRIDHGDTISSILEDYPQVDPKAVETAITFARAHPRVDRPGGRPWTAAA